MKAILVRDGKLVAGEAPAPSLKPCHIRIGVAVSGVNRADTVQRRGLYPPPPGESEILGLEVAGVVLEASPEVTRFKPGDRVMALLAGGGYAEQACVHETLALAVPEAMDWERAGGTPEVFLTAYLNLFMLGGVKKGSRVLLHAGASGVGTAALQLLRGVAGEVYATVGSREKAAVVEKLGAIPILYKESDFTERAKDVDVILDPVGGSHWQKNVAALATDGTLILIGLMGGREASTDLGRVLMKRLRLQGSTLRSLPFERKRELVARFEREVWPRLDSGELGPVLDRSYPAAEAAEAHRRMEANENIGKILLKWT